MFKLLSGVYDMSQTVNTLRSTNQPTFFRRIWLNIFRCLRLTRH